MQQEMLVPRFEKRLFVRETPVWPAFILCCVIGAMVIPVCIAQLAPSPEFMASLTASGDA